MFTSTKLRLSTASFFLHLKVDVTSRSLSISPTFDAPSSNSIKLSIAEVSSALENVNLHKSPGTDKLPASILKEWLANYSLSQFVATLYFFLSLPMIVHKIWERNFHSLPAAQQERNAPVTFSYYIKFWPHANLAI